MVNIDHCVQSTTWTVGRIPALVILGGKEKQNKEKLGAQEAWEGIKASPL